MAKKFPTRTPLFITIGLTGFMIFRLQRCYKQNSCRTLSIRDLFMSNKITFIINTNVQLQKYSFVRWLQTFRKKPRIQFFD